MASMSAQEQDYQQRVFADKCRRLHSHLLGTKNLLDSIRDYNRTKWPVRYPLAKIARAAEAQSGMGMPSGLRRSNSISHSMSTDSGLAPSPMRRAMTTEDSSAFSSRMTSSDDDLQPERLLDPNDLSVLRLDLRLSYHADSDVMGSLEESSISRLFDERLSQCEVHIDKLIARVTDKSSKILVTGDLNAGKSTLVNALLRREILPFDQQPCTMLFCEVVDASQNGGCEEIHAVPDIAKYDHADPSTYVTVSMSDLEDIVMDNEEQYQQLKIYSQDKRSDKESLLHNGVVDVSLIDSPGLNRDSLKTTQ
ncbi:mitofusin, partial [Linderina pennispora]